MIEGRNKINGPADCFDKVIDCLEQQEFQIEHRSTMDTERDWQFDEKWLLAKELLQK